LFSFVILRFLAQLFFRFTAEVSMTRTTRLNALEVAIANEMRERKFYLKHAERTTDPLGAAMFRQIADDELQHYEKLKQLQEGQESKEGLPETLPLEVLDINLKEILKETIRKLDELPQTDNNELDAIETAMEFEAKAAAFYTTLKGEVTDPKEKAFFDMLAKMEDQL
jgi:rubrerythrin